MNGPNLSKREYFTLGYYCFVNDKLNWAAVRDVPQHQRISFRIVTFPLDFFEVFVLV
jgi:hypothetical protein